ncbi:Phosphatidylinositol 3,5-bisphosphate-binding protein [Trichoglossum hirsutum]|uniref:Phosphatidylinositol 3,5-bisphosphate-binding protein n=1 Tax=Trichoglossum hirsutum TaxID=265104 RepID=A0A9P8RRZ3_9PEZI|nr:Phosphatidylinositol 3,5-bisphosphate-binding protein [Trichoglossum hirsutum]
MNTRQAIDNSSSPVSLSAAFNQDNTCFSVGLNSGFCVFNSDPCELRVARDFNAGIGLVEMLGRANYIALVGGGKQPKFPQNKVLMVIIWDDAKQKPVITLEFRSPIYRVRLSRTRIVVTLCNSIHVYAFSSPPEKLSVFETADNPFGLCCLGSRLLAFPGRTPGQVQLVEIGRGNVSIIPAHSAALRALDLSRDGEILATASETGTLIRIWSTTNCSRIAELRRGVDPAAIFSLAISPSNTLLATTSDKSTLHIFDLPHPHNVSRPEATIANRQQPPTKGSPASGSTDEVNSQKWGILGKIPLLPRVFSDVYSFTSAHFEIGDEGPLPGQSGRSSMLTAALSMGALGGRAPKGVVGWLTDDTLVVIGAGRDGRWEKFVLVEGEDRKRVCVRHGWRRYLGDS